ncbi:MAG: flagellar hook-associated protein FlgK [Nitrospirae bacterium]|nr:MAG: flagellar hook-associated protein FlgK [Nitrospirota bacterium]
MVGIDNIFQIGRVGIQAHQRALATIAHNIANLSTEGFARQEAVLETAIPEGGIVGSGVKVEQIRRHVDSFIEHRLTDVQEDVGRLAARQTALERTDGVLTESDNHGIGFSLSEFFNAVRDVATTPENAVQRTVMLEKGRALADEFNRVGKELDRIRRDIDAEIGRHLSTINATATQIASLNDQIFVAEANGESANDLRDKRQVLVNDLAELVDVEVVPQTDGLAVMVGGHLLVGGNTANALAQVADADNPPMNDVVFVRSDGTKLTITSKIGDGKIGGLLTARDIDIAGLQDRLDRTAAVLVNEFNRQHQAGYGLDGTTNNVFFAALSPEPPVASDANTGGAAGTSVTISTPSSLTFHEYEIQFTSATAYNVVDTVTGSTVISGGAYTSGGSITFDGLTVVITDNTGAPASGDVFTVNAHKGAAEDLAVSLSETDKIAASSTSTGVPGNNVNALALVDIHTTRHSTLGSVTLNDYHAITTGNVGSTTREVQLAKISTEAEFDQVMALRESVSGVSLDEEFTDLLSVQRAFEASARLITVADDLLQTLVTLGR